jgi:hypothetical protein
MPVPPTRTPSCGEEGQAPPQARRSTIPARSDAGGFDHRSVILPGTVVIACRPETAAGGRRSGGGVVDVEVDADVEVVVWVVVWVVVGAEVEAGGGGVPPPVGGGGGGLDASAAPAPAHRTATAAHAAASARIPLTDLTIPTSTASFQPEM